VESLRGLQFNSFEFLTHSTGYFLLKGVHRGKESPKASTVCLGDSVGAAVRVLVEGRLNQVYCAPW
jgi:hypothetical protein